MPKKRKNSIEFWWERVIWVKIPYEKCHRTRRIPIRECGPLSRLTSQSTFHLKRRHVLGRSDSDTLPTNKKVGVKKNEIDQSTFNQFLYFSIFFLIWTHLKLEFTVILLNLILKIFIKYTRVTTGECYTAVNQSINRSSINQSIDQSINHQSINHQSINWSSIPNQSINQSINRSIKYTQSINQSIKYHFTMSFRFGFETFLGFYGFCTHCGICLGYGWMGWVKVWLGCES